MKLVNQRMQEKIENGDAIDLARSKREGDYYIVTNFVQDVDYCDSSIEGWIWSIGRRLSDGTILASRSGNLYQNPDFECLWLR